jgi:outer membrane protein TolC
MRKPAFPLALLLVGMIAGLPAAARAASAEPAAPPVSALLAEALEKSAELAALREQIAAAEAKVIPAGAPADPVASVGLNNIPVGGLRLDEDMMTSVGVMVSQNVIRGARRRLRSGVQQGEVAALRARAASVENGIVRGVKQACVDLQYLDEAAQIAEENKRLAEDVLAIAESRYGTGKVGQQDVFQAQVQLSRLLESLLTLRRQRLAAATRLNRLLYRTPGQALARFPALSRTSLPSYEASAESLAESNSVVRELLARTGQAESGADLARQWRRPDYMLSFAYMIRQRLAEMPSSGEDMWSASIAIGLPWRNRRAHESEVASAQAEQRRARQDVEAQLNAIPARLEELTIEIERAEEQLALVETGLLPQAEGALAASRSAYATGRTDSINVLNNQLGLYNLQLERIQLLREHEQNLAELEYEAKGALGPMAPAAAAVGAGMSAMGAGQAPGRGDSSSSAGGGMSGPM